GQGHLPDTSSRSQSIAVTSQHRGVAYNRYSVPEHQAQYSQPGSQSSTNAWIRPRATTTCILIKPLPDWLTSVRDVPPSSRIRERDTGFARIKSTCIRIVVTSIRPGPVEEYGQCRRDLRLGLWFSGAA